MPKPTKVKSAKASQVPCKNCPLRAQAAFRAFKKPEFAFVEAFKSGELSVEAGATLFAEGTDSAHLYTVLSGWAFRYKMLEDGRRQILNFALPGDLLGLQSAVFEKLNHSAESLTDLVLCVFERKQLWHLYKKHPGLAFDITWLASREESILDENLISVGRRSARERVSYLLLLLFERAERIGQAKKTTALFPVTQDHLADALGLSLVHTNKTLRRLVKDGLIKWNTGQLEICELDGLAEVAGYEFESHSPRPFI